MGNVRNTYVQKLTDDQINVLYELLKNRDWQFDEQPHARWRARKEKTVIIVYQSGKTVIQGKGTEDFVRFTLEPEIAGEARMGYEHLLAEKDNPQMFEPHIGVDESGKGDYFGPLVIAAVYTDEESARKLLELGVRDSKIIKNDRHISSLTHKIKETVNRRFSVVPIGVDAYNRLYRKIGNLNRLLGWGHARALENLLEKTPDCPRAVSDKFAHESVIRNSLQERGKKIELAQITKGEADVAVAAASILARAEFVSRLGNLEKEFSLKLPKGAGEPVFKAACSAVSTHGREVLEKIAKTHFKTTSRVLEETSA